MAVVCDICGAKMPTLKVLEQHKAKRHSAKPEETKPTLRSEKTEEVMPGVKPAVTVRAGMVELISADNRVLECSIGAETWKGKSIVIPAKFESEIRRLLETAGFFLKN